MSFGVADDFRARHRRPLIFAALLLLAGAVATVLDRPTAAGDPLLSLTLFGAGGALVVWILGPRHPTVEARVPTLATRLLRGLTWDGRLLRLFPAVGVGVIFADLYYNYFLSASPQLLTEDLIALLTAGALVGYAFVPERYGRERDFVLTFFLVLDVLLVLPLLLLRLSTQELGASVDIYSWVAVAPETSALLSLLGVQNQLGQLPGITAPGLTFTPVHMPSPVTVVITAACSGIYSFGIFASAFAAYTLTEFQRISRRMWGFLALGMFSAYVANILRMVIIVLIGYYEDSPTTDLQNMLVAHSYAGWAIFLAWVAVFWLALLRASTSLSDPDFSGKLSTSRRRSPPRCGICSQELRPFLFAMRCECGMFLHLSCLDDDGRCPNCGTALVQSGTGKMAESGQGTPSRAVNSNMRHD